MSLVRRFLKWTAVAFGVVVLVYTVWFAVFLVCFYYASSKYDQITVGDTRNTIEARKGLMSSRQVDPTSLGGYQFVFQELVAEADNEIVAYSLFGAFFTVIYDKDGSVLAYIDNGLDG